MDKFSFGFCFLALFTLLSMTAALRIQQLRVPEVVNIKTIDSVILDCDYDVENDATGLVLKWFFEDDTRPIYQWIPSRAPQALGILKDKVDLSFKASEDQYTMYRALKIVNLSRNMTGVYKCEVSTFEGEAKMAKKMIVLEPPKKVEMLQVKRDSDSVTITCSTYGMFPKPSLNISYEGSPLIEDIEHESTKSDDGLYNVTTLVTVKDETLESPTEFKCIIRIPNTGYEQEEELTYYPDNSAVSTSSLLWMSLIFATILTLFFS